MFTYYSALKSINEFSLIFTAKCYTGNNYSGVSPVRIGVEGGDD